jgi:ribosome-associated protein
MTLQEVNMAATRAKSSERARGRTRSKDSTKGIRTTLAKAKSAPAVTTQSPRKPARRAKSSPPALAEVITAALDDMKAANVRFIDVRGVTDIADTMVVASGTSDRHVRSIADRVVERAKQAGFRPMGVEGERDGEWVLVDLQDIIVHVMLPRVREFYRLEALWDLGPARREAAAAHE